MRWTCPRCDREFGRARQAHTCVPGISVDSVFDPRPAYMREVYDEILSAIGPVHEDAVGVGVFLKVRGTVAEVRPMVTQLSVLITLPRKVEDERIARVMAIAEGKWMLDVRYREADRLADKERTWLREAWDFAG
jgi:hypothetical protein